MLLAYLIFFFFLIPRLRTTSTQEHILRLVKSYTSASTPVSANFSCFILSVFFISGHSVDVIFARSLFPCYKSTGVTSPCHSKGSGGVAHGLLNSFPCFPVFFSFSFCVFVAARLHFKKGYFRVLPHAAAVLSAAFCFVKLFFLFCRSSLSGFFKSAFYNFVYVVRFLLFCQKQEHENKKEKASLVNYFVHSAMIA